MLLQTRADTRTALIAVLVLALTVAGCGATASPSPSEATRASTTLSSAPASAPSSSPGVSAGASIAQPSLSPTAARIQDLKAAVQANPDNAEAWVDLGLELLQRVRETADPSLYQQADEALRKAEALDPEDPLAVTGLGTLQLARHQFAEALVTGRRALKLTPGLTNASAVIVDALVELGRYDDAEVAAQAMVDARPNLASYARVSYLRELHGDLKGAVEAMEAAVTVGAGVPENEAYVTTLLGNLLVVSGRRADAAKAYDRALTVFPDYPPAIAGQARLAVGDGDLPRAIERLTKASAIVPLPEYVIALGEAQEASGDKAAARRSYDLARAETALFKANGVVIDLELALFEADHGDATTALDLANDAYAERRTIRTADALAWASLKAGRLADARRLSAEALRLGTRDPLLLYHAGAIAAAAGDTGAAKRDLRAALALDPGFSATGAAAARTLLTQLAG